VRAMVENGYGTTDPDYRRLLAEARARGVPITTARARRAAARRPEPDRPCRDRLRRSAWSWQARR
jgi:hypothetical protein